jgi:hypothetical protein
MIQGAAFDFNRYDRQYESQDELCVANRDIPLIGLFGAILAGVLAS